MHLYRTLCAPRPPARDPQPSRVAPHTASNDAHGSHGHAWPHPASRRPPATTAPPLPRGTGCWLFLR
eukprot:scaffold6669_cov146-Isochrysis_galbana.AAC.2